MSRYRRRCAAFFPYGTPERKCAPIIWHYNEVRPLSLQAGDLTPLEKAERRVLILAHPALDPATARATSTIYLDLQLIKPGETPPNHKHSPRAIRFVVEGESGFAMVEGEKLPGDNDDLILTTSGRWHKHGSALITIVVDTRAEHVSRTDLLGLPGHLPSNS